MYHDHDLTPLDILTTHSFGHGVSSHPFPPPQHDWVSRRADQGPKTIEQIHKEAKIEEQEEQRKVQQQLLNKDAAKRRPGRS